jgi:hypothetical protein
MASKNDLQELQLVKLAVLCQKVVDDTGMDEPTWKKAGELHQEWVSLVARETPNAPDFKTHQEIQAAKAELKNRMVEFLALI